MGGAPPLVLWVWAGAGHCRATDWVCTTPGASGMGTCSSRAVDPVHTFLGLRGRGAGGRWLLWRIPQTAAECLFFLFFFLKNSSYSSPLVQTSTWPLIQPNLAPKNLEADLAGAGPGVVAALVPTLVQTIS